MEEQLDLYCDGSSTNDAGPRSMARWAVTFESGKKVVDVTGWGTNNEAEYKGLIAALNFVMLMPEASHVVIHMDSELVFMQVMDKYKVKSKRLKPLCELVKKLMAATITRVLSLELALETGGKNPAHITVAAIPDVFNGITHIVDLLPKYQEMLNIYNEHIDRLEDPEDVIDTSIWNGTRRPFKDEVRQEARQWINETGKRALGNLDSKPSKKFIWWLYKAGAESVEAVNAVGKAVQHCNTLRVKLPYIPSEDLTNEGDTATDKALECLTIMTDIEEANVQQAWDDQTVFYISW